jgi:hypothetical protein
MRAPQFIHFHNLCCLVPAEPESAVTSGALAGAENLCLYAP